MEKQYKSPIIKNHKITKKKTRCVTETRMPPKCPFFEKCNLYI